MAFTFGTATRNTMWGAGLSKVDLALDRELPLLSAPRLHVRLEAFNLFNTVNYGTEPVRQHATIWYDH